MHHNSLHHENYYLAKVFVASVIFNNCDFVDN